MLSYKIAQQYGLHLASYTQCDISKAVQRYSYSLHAWFVLNYYFWHSSVTNMLSRLSWHPLWICRSSLNLQDHKSVSWYPCMHVTQYLKETFHWSRKHIVTVINRCLILMQILFFHQLSNCAWNNLNERQMNMTWNFPRHTWFIVILI